MSKILDQMNIIIQEQILFIYTLVLRTSCFTNKSGRKTLHLLNHLEEDLYFSSYHPHPPPAPHRQVMVQQAIGQSPVTSCCPCLAPSLTFQISHSLHLSFFHPFLIFSFLWVYCLIYSLVHLILQSSFVPCGSYENVQN